MLLLLPLPAVLAIIHPASGYLFPAKNGKVSVDFNIIILKTNLLTTVSMVKS